MAPAVVTRLIEAWSAYYGNHQMVSVTTRYLHLAALVIGGGAALSADRHVLTARHDRRTIAEALSRTHRVVVPSLMILAITGTLMTLADLSTFIESTLFRAKLGVVALLMINGLALVGAESAVMHGRGTRSWMRLVVASAVSVVLWLTALFLGTWLTVAA